MMRNTVANVNQNNHDLSVSHNPTDFRSLMNYFWNFMDSSNADFTELSPKIQVTEDKDAVKVDLEDDGRVIIYHTDANIIAKTRKMIEDVAREVEEGAIYTGRVVKVEDFGCFVELWPGCEGLVHVSELDHKRVDKPKDIVSVGDKILVKALGYDNRGRLNLSRKQAISKPDKKEDKKRK